MSATHLTFTVSFGCYNDIAGLLTHDYKHGNGILDQGARGKDNNRRFILFGIVRRSGGTA